MGIAKMIKAINTAWRYNQGQRINEDWGYYAYTNGTKQTPGKSSVISVCVTLLHSTSAISSDVDKLLQQEGQAFKSPNSDSMDDTERLSKWINNPLSQQLLPICF
jgi:hypothetical protein